MYLVELFSSYDPVQKLSEYKLLERVLHDQCLITDTGTDTQVALKPPKEVSPDSLQNPSDPNAGYDSHKGQGYKAQIMETYHDEKQDDTKPNLITYVDVEPAHEHDANALQPAIDAAQERDCCPEELTCDTLYGGDDNVQKAATKGVEVVAPLAGRAPKGDISLSDFTFDEKTRFGSTACLRTNQRIQRQIPMAGRYRRNKLASQIRCRNRTPESTRYGLSALRCHPQGARIEHPEVRRSTMYPFVPLFYTDSGHQTSRCESFQRTLRAFHYFIVKEQILLGY